MSNNYYPRYILIASFCCLMLVFACRSARTTRGSLIDDMTQIGSTTLAKGAYSGIEEKKYVIVTSQEEWEELWEKTHKFITPAPDLPAIDFSWETVLGVFMGSRPSGGYSIVIEQLEFSEGRVQATIKTRAPEPGDMVTTALTQPYHIIRAGVTGKDIEFIKK